MTEGELKKRAEALWDEHAYELVPDHFFPIIDEAKKDFAKILHTKNPSYWVDHAGEIYFELLRTFNKWFGIFESDIVEELPSPES